MRINHVALYCLDLEGMKDFFIRYFKGVPNELYHNPRTALKIPCAKRATNDR